MFYFAAELNSFLKTLNERAEVEKHNSNRHTTERMKRVEGSQLHSHPPNGAPPWCVDKEWKKGNNHYEIVCVICATYNAHDCVNLCCVYLSCDVCAYVCACAVCICCVTCVPMYVYVLCVFVV